MLHTHNERQNYTHTARRQTRISRTENIPSEKTWYQNALVERHETNVALGEGALAGVDLAEHLVGVSAAEHGQLPHCPVTVVVVVLQARSSRQAIFPWKRSKSRGERSSRDITIDPHDPRCYRLSTTTDLAHNIMIWEAYA